MNKDRILKITTPFEEVKKLSKKMSLTLLSTSMKNQQEKLDWKCRNGHEFDYSFYHMKRFCNNSKDNIRVCKTCSDQLDFMEIERRGLDHTHELTLLDKSFISMSHEYKWKCREGHINPFKAPTHDNRGGCPDCIDQKKFNSIEKINKWLQLNADEMKVCEGESYNGSSGPINLYCRVCAKTTPRLPHQIKNHSLCKYCSGYKYELTVMQYMESLCGGEWLYNRKSLKWLKNENGNKMELDGYCAKLKLAFEHHGKQHYQIVEKRTTSKKALKESQDRDRLKEKLCIKNGIKLIVIRELNTHTPIKILKEEIKNQCNGIKTKYFGGFNDETVMKKHDLPENFDQIQPVIKNLHNRQLKKRWPEILKLAKKLNFEVINPKTIRNEVELKCKACSKITSRSIYVFLVKQGGCTCQGMGWGIDLSNDEVMKKWYTDVAKKHNAEFVAMIKDKNKHNSLKFKCKTCQQNPKLIQPVHSEFIIKDYSFRDRFEKPLTKMNLKSRKKFHPDCGAFGITKLTLKDVKKYIKRFERTAEILTTEKDFTNTTMSKYQFKCSNKRHAPHVFPPNPKYLREIKQMGENQSFGCPRCGQLNRNERWKATERNKM